MKRKIRFAALTVPALLAPGFFSACRPARPAAAPGHSRLDSAVAVFWNEADFSSPRTDTAWWEQQVADFVCLASHAADSAADSAMTRLARRVLPTPRFQLLDSLLYLYLDHPDSPQRNERLLIPWLRVLAASGPGGRGEAAAWRLDMALRNRPGTQAADFAAEDTEGREVRFRDLVGPRETLVVFYDPDCTACAAMKQKLIDGHESDRRDIVAVCVAGSRTHWLEDAAHLPASWRKVRALDDLDGNDIYPFRTLPALYLLAPDATVIAKDL